MEFNAELEENIFESIKQSISEDYDLNDFEFETLPPLLNNKKIEKPRLFSLAQVSSKLNELWSSARERVFGENYWIPSDPYEVAFFPQELLSAHKTVYPISISNREKKNDNVIEGHVSLIVVQGSLKNEPEKNFYHVVCSYSYEGHRETLTIFRSTEMTEAIDFYRRCEECRVLLRLLDKKKDVRKAIRDITHQFQIHPLWRMVHIAIACNRTDVFTDEGLNYLKSIGYLVEDLINATSSPEGQSPLTYAIQTNQESIVRFLLKIGSDPAKRDITGNNAMHYAALASVQMLEALWENELAKPLLNSINNDGSTPVILAIRNANPRCLATLLGFGAELSIRVTGRNPLFEAVQSKGKTAEVIRTLLDALPNLIKETDEATGNTVLHAAMFKGPLMGLLFLKCHELDLNAKNKAGQTPLHLYTSRGDLGMILTLASYNCDLQVPNQSGDTALHIAVSKRFLIITRLLLCLGADPNRLNAHGDSPRHLAAKLGEQNLLKSLIICGAKRCHSTKTGCVSGCVNKKMLSLQLLSKQPSCPNISGSNDQTLTTRSMSAIEDLENRTFVNNVKKEYRYNEIIDAEHNEIYEEMLNRLKEFKKNNVENRNILNVLSVDGGGIRGLVICQILIEVEKIMGESIFPYFDWSAGTSTGALITTALALGHTLRHIQIIYLRFKDLIFDGWTRPYNSLMLETFIQKELGVNTLLSDIKWPRLMFTTTRADCFPVQLEIIRNYQLPLNNEDNLNLGFTDPTELTVWKALRRTSAAPTYFSCVDNRYIDGGIIANNPTLELMAEIQLYNTKLNNNVEVGCVLSIGTGVIPTLPIDPNHLEFSANPYTTAMAIKNLGTILVDQVTATEGAPVNRASSWCINSRTPYFRLSAPIFKEVPMDSKDDNDLAQMMWDCVEYAYRHKEYIEKICVLIKEIGVSCKRQQLFVNKNKLHHDMETQTSSPPSPTEIEN